jgi:hypothetical protein
MNVYTAYGDLSRSSLMSPRLTPESVHSFDGALLQSTLRGIADAEAEARMHFERSRAGGDPDECAAAAQAADLRASAGRILARQIVERAFPGCDCRLLAEVLG